MVWCHDKKIIFIHIPKTGGTKIENNLNLMRGTNGYGTIKSVAAAQHFLWHDYKLLLGNEIYNNYYKFTIVRHPVTRCISEHYWTPLRFGNKKETSFDEFLKSVEKIVKNKNYYETQWHDHFMPQSRYIFNNKKICMVDKIFRFEKYDEVIKHFNLDNEVYNECKKKNKLKPTEEQISKIYEIYKEDYINFNYDKNI